MSNVQDNFNELDNIIVVDEYGDSYTLTDVVGSGGQGTVWKVNGDSRIVVKTLTDSETGEIVCDEEVYNEYSKKIRSLIALSVLEDIQNISVPIAMLKKPMCGYVMRFMEGMEQLSRQKTNKYNNISKKDKNSSIKKKYKVMRNIADTVRKLHNSGLVYCDFSANNIFVSKGVNDYEAWLIDPDNLTYSNKNKGCIYTIGYGAPEVYKGYRNTIYTDIYSAAVVWFEYLVGSKPFNHVEPVEDSADEDDFVSFSSIEYQTDDEVYMYESDDLEKVGIPAEYVFTEKVYNLFWRTFSKEGRENPFSRPTANEWYEAFDEALDEITRCSNNHYHLSDQCMWCYEDDCEKEDINNYYSIVFEGIPDFNERIDENWEENEPSAPYQAYETRKVILYIDRIINKNQIKAMEVRDLEILNNFFSHSDELKCRISSDENKVKLKLCDKYGKPIYKLVWEYKKDKKKTFYTSGLKRNYIISFSWGE